MKQFEKIIERTDHPATIESLTADLQKIGIKQGITLAVHSSLSAIGYVVGDGNAVIMALQNALGDGGTLAMPSHSFHLSEPFEWKKPAVPKEWHQTIIDHMPGFHKDIAIWRSMGKIPACLHAYKSTMRSDHPNTSWLANGKHADIITTDHSLNMSQSDDSPVGKLYDLDAYILLLGVPYKNNTAFHLAEYRTRFARHKQITRRAPILKDNQTQWISYQDIIWSDEDFDTIGAAFERETNNVNHGKIGLAKARLFPMRAIVDFAVPWMNNHRSMD